MCSRTLLIALGLIFVLVPTIAALPHRQVKRSASFFDLDCKGVYNKSIFFRLDRICEDCYSLFHVPQLHARCKEDCFQNDYFKGCVEALLLDEEFEKFDKWREMLGKKK